MMQVFADRLQARVRQDFADGLPIAKILCPHTGQSDRLHELLGDLTNDPESRGGVFAGQLQADLATYNSIFNAFNLPYGDTIALRRVLTK